MTTTKQPSLMMRSYLELKEKYKDCIVFYRLGDFYEMFFDDAVLASELLDLTLTGRNCGLEERAPMCGVPYHAADTYIAKLIGMGHKVAVCEQLNTPKDTGGKMVDRDVVRVITPGTVIEDSLLEEKKNNYIACCHGDNERYALAWLDISTGEFSVYEDKATKLDGMDDMLVNISPAEIICDEYVYGISCGFSSVKAGRMPKFSKYFEGEFTLSRASETLKKHFGVATLSAFELEGKNYAISACGALIAYVNETQKRSLSHINSISYRQNNNYLNMDSNTRTNLELLQNARDSKRKASLLWVLDSTRTNMGARNLRRWIEQPLRNKKRIQERLDSVEELISKTSERNTLLQLLKSVKDIERLASRLSYGTISPRDLLSIGESLKNIPALKNILDTMSAEYLRRINGNIFELSDICLLISDTIDEKAPVTVKDGGIIKEGFSSDLDSYRNAGRESTQWLTRLEAQERELTGIKNLKISYNKVFGYYIEVAKGSVGKVPSMRYIRKQTLTTGERYITEELKQIEDKVLGSTEKALELELKIFDDVKKEVSAFIPELQSTSRNIAALDTLLSFAVVALENGYCKPIISDDLSTSIIGGRHPVVEKLLKRNDFVPNDCSLDCSQERMMIITGPNMAGKSTYMRQIALITLMAHIGCYVPAKSARIAIADRIFTRIGASDDLSYGQSTFMVEMIEVATILQRATISSLVVLDEIGRGTSTFDGLSIAGAVVEDIAKRIKCKTLFSTHYHELTELEGRIEGVRNYKVTAAESKNSVIFLHKIMRGGTNKSFGIEVAGLAGIPKSVITRAKEISKQLENSPLSLDDSSDADSLIAICDNNTFRDKLKAIDIDTLSPIQAFSILHELVDSAKRQI